MTDPHDTIPAPGASTTNADLLRAIGECATKQEMQAVVKALGDVVDELARLREGLNSDEFISKVARRMLQQMGNGAG